jgi:hypothetical protein
VFILRKTIVDKYTMNRMNHSHKFCPILNFPLFYLKMLRKVRLNSLQ